VSSINRELQVLRRALRLAVEWGRVPRVTMVRMLPGERRRNRVLHRDEEACYLRHAVEPLKTLAILLLDTGLRPEEAQRLRWEHVNAKTNQLLVTDGKTAAARRAVPFTTRVRGLLVRRWLKAGRPTTGWVFPANTKSGHAEPSTVRKQHARAIDASGVTRFLMYTCRHTFLTRLGESGCDAWTLARIAGQATISISARYVHPGDEAVKAAIRRLQGQR
jgi:integrase